MHLSQNAVIRHFQNVFKGDPLEYRLFMRAFEHGVEDRTESDKDRLYYMEQYTSGQPRELIRSCLHMEPTHGYQTAKRLLEEHFGNAYKISVAYIHKALNWPTIKSDDGEALHAFGLYLTGCHNAMMDVEYMEELDNTANMRAIISKLLYKLRERWRTFACGVLDKAKRRVKFADLAEFVNKQAKEVLHPLFGDIKDGTLKRATLEGKWMRGCKGEVEAEKDSPQLQLSPLHRTYPLKKGTRSAEIRCVHFLNPVSSVVVKSTPWNSARG